MQGFFGKLWDRLDRRLILLICMIVIPINILAITFSSMAVREAQERVTLSQVREFEHLASQENGKLQALSDWQNTFINSSLDRLNSPRRFSAVQSINYVKNMGDCLADHGIHGFAFLWEHQEEEKLYIKSGASPISLTEIESLKPQLKQAGDEPIQQFSGTYYYCFRQSFRNYTIGYCIDLGRELQGWNTPLLEGCTVLLSDGQKELCFDRENVWEVEETVREDLPQTELGNMTASLICAKASASAAYVFLQVLAWGSLVLLVILWLTIRRLVIRPIRKLQTAMEDLDRDVSYRMDTQAETQEFSYLYATFNKMAGDIQQSHHKDILLYETQLNNLKLQVNPHMLLNSLTMIYSMAQTEQYTLIQKFTMSLVEYFRYCLRENDDLVPLKSELKFVASYMELQKMRFPGELASNYLVQDGLEEALIPPLLIQNFVENAAKYARLTDQTTEILIWVRRQGTQMCIDIVDTGKGMDPQILACIRENRLYTDRNGLQHIGIWNCRRRLEAFFGKNVDFSIESENGKGTTVRILLPIKEKEMPDDYIDRG